MSGRRHRTPGACGPGCRHSAPSFRESAHDLEGPRGCSPPTAYGNRPRPLLFPPPVQASGKVMTALGVTALQQVPAGAQARAPELRVPGSSRRRRRGYAAGAAPSHASCAGSSGSPGALEASACWASARRAVARSGARQSRTMALVRSSVSHAILVDTDQHAQPGPRARTWRHASGSAAHGHPKHPRESRLRRR